MKAPAGLTNALREQRLDVHVHVLAVRAPDHLTRLDLFADLLQARLDLRAVLVAHDALRREHLNVRDRAADVVLRKALVDVDARVESRRNGIELLIKATAPGFLLRLVILVG